MSAKTSLPRFTWPVSTGAGGGPRKRMKAVKRAAWRPPGPVTAGSAVRAGAEPAPCGQTSVGDRGLARDRGAGEPRLVGGGAARQLKQGGPVALPPEAPPRWLPRPEVDPHRPPAGPRRGVPPLRLRQRLKGRIRGRIDQPEPEDRL